MMRKIKWLFVVALLAVTIAAVGTFVRRSSSIERRFTEEIHDVRGNAGDVLEVATMTTAFTASESDKLEVPVLGIPVNLGTTEAYLTVPVTYRFHIRLSGDWKIKETREHVEIVAPRVRPSQPPAPDMSGAEYLTRNGWARFNKDDVRKRVEATISPRLALKAEQFASSNLVRDRARESVAAFLKQRFTFLSTAAQKKLLLIRFEDEPASAAAPKG